MHYAQPPEQFILGNGFAYRAQLVRKAYQQPLAKARRYRRKREHVPVNDIALYAVQVESPLRVAQCPARMPEPVQPVRRVGIVPVVQEKVVQQRAAHHAAPIHAYAQPLGQPKAHAGDVYRMGVTRRGAVLHEYMFELHFAGREYVAAMLEKYRAIAGAA